MNREEEKRRILEAAEARDAERRAHAEKPPRPTWIQAHREAELRDLGHTWFHQGWFHWRRGRSVPATSLPR